jgi:hypothetical protein
MTSCFESIEKRKGCLVGQKSSFFLSDFSECSPGRKSPEERRHPFQFQEKKRILGPIISYLLELVKTQILTPIQKG